MTDSIKEQMLKMGLVTADQVSAEPRQDRGRNQSGAEPRAGDRPRATQATAEAGLVARIADSGRLAGKTEGRNRFYFETRDGRVPYIEIGQETVARLASGRAAVCESPEGAVSLVDGEAAARIAALDRGWLRAWNG